MNKKRKNLRNLSRIQAITPLQEQKLPFLDFVKAIVYLLSISGVLLIVLGYGRITGLAAPFGLAALELVDDKTDFLYEAALPLMQFYTQVVEVLTSPIFWTLIFCIIGLGSIFYIIVRCLRSTTVIRRYVKAKFDQVDYFFESSAFDLGPIAGFVRTVLKILTEIVTFMSPIWFLLGVITLVLLIGLSGYYQGKKLANDYIISPKKCAGSLIAESNQEKVAICVAVFSDRNEVARGRVIATTKERVFLYTRGYQINDKGTKETIRIPKSYPIRNAIVERVDSEDLQPEEQQLRDVEMAIAHFKLTQLPLSCLSYRDFGIRDGKQVVNVYEKHGGECAGDPNTSPKLFAIGVDQKTGAFWSDINTKSEGGDLEKLTPSQ